MDRYCNTLMCVSYSLVKKIAETNLSSGLKLHLTELFFPVQPFCSWALLSRSFKDLHVTTTQIQTFFPPHFVLILHFYSMQCKSQRQAPASSVHQALILLLQIGHQKTLRSQDKIFYPFVHKARHQEIAVRAPLLLQWLCRKRRWMIALCNVCSPGNQKQKRQAMERIPEPTHLSACLSRSSREPVTNLLTQMWSRWLRGPSK